MFITIQRQNPHSHFNTGFNPFSGNRFNLACSSFVQPRRVVITKEEQLRRSLQSLQDQENNVLNNIKLVESKLEQLNLAKSQIELEKQDLNEQINKIVEEKKQKEQERKQDEKNAVQNGQNQNLIFKKFYYKTDNEEIEEYHDYENPQNNYKFVKILNETPKEVQQNEQPKQQVIEQTTQSNEQIQQTKKYEEQINEQKQTLETKKPDEVIEDFQVQKYEQLSKIIGKQLNEIKQLVIENKDLSIGQLYDKAVEQKLI